MAKACGLWIGKVGARRFTHAGQEAVDKALAGGRKRAIGSAGGWGWDRTDETVNIAPIVSETLALFAASTVKPKTTTPGRNGRTGMSRERRVAAR
jgi:hypothetical protein